MNKYFFRRESYRSIRYKKMATRKCIYTFSEAQALLLSRFPNSSAFERNITAKPLAFSCNNFYLNAKCDLKWIPREGHGKRRRIGNERRRASPDVEMTFRRRSRKTRKGRKAHVSWKLRFLAIQNGISRRPNIRHKRGPLFARVWKMTSEEAGWMGRL